MLIGDHNEEIDKLKKFFHHEFEIKDGDLKYFASLPT